MTAVLFALALAALISGAYITGRRKPAYRAAARGAVRAGAKQTRKEWRAGYTRARGTYERTQKKLRKRGTRRARAASFLLELLGVTLVTAGGAVYGAAVTAGAAGRVVREATRGARREYESYKNAIDVEVVEAEETTPATAKPADPAPAAPAEQPKTETPAEPQASDPAETTEAPAAPPTETPQTGTAPVTTTEGTTTMAQSEASGLTSFSQAHSQMADEIGEMVSASQGLVTSMSDLLADHSSLVGNAATLQDLLTQAQNAAQQIADDSATAAAS